MFANVRQISKEEWFARQKEWNQLVVASSANPLFMSHEWLTAWWDVYGEITNSELIVLVSEDRNGQLIGAVPFYISTRRRYGILVKTAILVGNLWRKTGAFISEKQNILALPNNRDLIISSLLRHFMNNYDWDKFVVPFFLLSKSNQKDFQTIENTQLMVRLADYDSTYSIDLSDRFESYKSRLSYNSRRHMFTYRKRLQDQGSVCVQQHAPPVDGSWYEGINRLVERRWSKTMLNPIDLNFLKRLSSKNSEIKLITTSVTLNNQLLSTSLDIRAGFSQFNLLLAFDDSLATNLSPGILHLGHLIETAATNQINKYDLLGGVGKTFDYKKNISDTQEDICTVYFVKKKWLSAIYLIKSHLK